MYCKNCGSPLTENDVFCKNCGTAVTAPNNGNVVSNPTVGEVAPNPVANQPVVQPTPMNEPVQPAPMNEPVQPTPTVQPTVQAQPMMNNFNQPMVNNQNNMPNKDNANVKYIVLGVVAVVALLSIAIVVASIFIGKSTTTSNNDNPNQATATPTSKENVTTVKLGKWSYQLPIDYQYEIQNNQLAIVNDDETWMFTIEIIDDLPYSRVKLNKDRFVPELGGIKTANVQAKSYNGIEMVTFEAEETVIYAYAKADNNSVFGIIAMDINEEPNYEILNETAKILSTAKYSSNSLGMATNKNFKNIDINKYLVD